MINKSAFLADAIMYTAICRVFSYDVRNQRVKYSIFCVKLKQQIKRALFFYYKTVQKYTTFLCRGMPQKNSGSLLTDSAIGIMEKKKFSIIYLD